MDANYPCATLSRGTEQTIRGALKVFWNPVLSGARFDACSCIEQLHRKIDMRFRSVGLLHHLGVEARSAGERVVGVVGEFSPEGGTIGELVMDLVDAVEQVVGGLGAVVCRRRRGGREHREAETGGDQDATADLAGRERSATHEEH